MNPYMRGKTNRRGYLREPPAADVFERVTLGLQSARSGDRLVVKVTAALVATNAPALKRLVEDAIAEGVTMIELDLSACDRGDSRGLGHLVSIARTCQLHRFGAQLAPVALLITAISENLLVQMRHFAIDKLFAIQEPNAFPETPHSAESYDA